MNDVRFPGLLASFVRCFFFCLFLLRSEGNTVRSVDSSCFLWAFRYTIVKMRIYVADVGPLYLHIYMYIRKYYVLCLCVAQQSFHEV